MKSKTKSKDKGKSKSKALLPAGSFVKDYMQAIVAVETVKQSAKLM